MHLLLYWSWVFACLALFVKYAWIIDVFHWLNKKRKPYWCGWCWLLMKVNCLFINFLELYFYVIVEFSISLFLGDWIENTNLHSLINNLVKFQFLCKHLYFCFRITPSFVILFVWCIKPVGCSIVFIERSRTDSCLHW